MKVDIGGVRHHKCDYCRKDFTEENVEHLSFEIGKRSGWSKPFESRDDDLIGWRFVRLLDEGHYDFCLAPSQCLQGFFDALGKDLPNTTTEYIR